MAFLTYAWEFLRQGYRINILMDLTVLKHFDNLTKAFFRVFGELYLDDYDSGKQDFNGDKICLQLDQTSSIGNYSLLEDQDRCPNLAEKSIEKLVFRIVLYLFIFIINVILVNILIGQISFTLNEVMKGDDKDYYLSALQLKVGLNERD